MATTLQLISASPSPYARKVRIALAEKRVPFELVTEVPWDSTATTPKYNPIGKLPVLLIPNGHPAATAAAPSSGPAVAVANGTSDVDGRPRSLSGGEATSIYESHYILEWLDAVFAPPQHFALLDPSLSVAERFKAKQVEVVADGMCDALVLRLFETRRDKPSPEWTERQMKKIRGGLGYLDATLGGKQYMVGGGGGGEDGIFGLADIAAGAVLGYMDVRYAEYDWRSQYPRLDRYMDVLMRRQSFKDTVPFAQDIKDKIV